MKKYLKEPLLHFVLIGIALFFYYSFVGENQDKDQIIIDDDHVNELVAKFEMQWNRKPTKEELVNIIETELELEVFYREAMAMQMEHNDDIIKRRLAQKVKFLLSEISELEEPKDEDLESFLKENSERYTIPKRVTFFQIFVSPDEHQNFREQAKSINPKSNDIDPESMRVKGDKISIPYKFENAPLFEIDRILGREFKLGIEKVTQTGWTDPIESGYGMHLVYVDTIIPKQTASLEEVRVQLKRDYLYQKQLELEKSVLTSLKAKYDIDFDIEQFDEETINYIKDQVK